MPTRLRGGKPRLRRRGPVQEPLVSISGRLRESEPKARCNTTINRVTGHHLPSRSEVDMASVVMKRFPSAPGTCWRENQSVRTRAQELRKPRRHRPPLWWENETSTGNPESSCEAIAVRDAVHGQSRAPEAEFGHVRLRGRRPEPVRRRRRRKEPKHLPRHRLERVHGQGEDRPSQSGGARPAQAAPSDRPNLDRFILGYRDGPTAHVASR